MKKKMDNGIIGYVRYIEESVEICAVNDNTLLSEEEEELVRIYKSLSLRDRNKLMAKAFELEDGDVKK